MYILAYVVLGFCFLMFLYFGYRDDFRRGPQEFINTVLGVLILGSIFIILEQIELNIPLWIKVIILIGFVLVRIFYPNPKDDDGKIINTNK